jgi:hypothetical protein
MNTSRLMTIAKRLTPKPVKRRCRRWADSVQFRVALSRFRRLNPNVSVPRDVLESLIRGWGSEWTASPEYLDGVLEALRQTSGSVLECGSGLTTLLIGIRCQQAGRRIWSLEHHPDWAVKIESDLARYRVHAATVHRSPLVNYGSYSWYDVSGLALPSCFSLVICDGPPSDTVGGRYGLFPVIGTRLTPDAHIILDDADRPGEQNVLKKWTSLFGATYRMVSCARPYAVVICRTPGVRSQ